MVSVHVKEQEEMSVLVHGVLMFRQIDRHQKAHSFVCTSMYYKSKLEDLNEIGVFY